MISEETKHWAAQALYKALGEEMKIHGTLPSSKNMNLIREALDLIQQLNGNDD